MNGILAALDTKRQNRSLWGNGCWFLLYFWQPWALTYSATCTVLYTWNVQSLGCNIVAQSLLKFVFVAQTDLQLKLILLPDFQSAEMTGVYHHTHREWLWSYILILKIVWEVKNITKQLKVLVAFAKALIRISAPTSGYCSFRGSDILLCLLQAPTISMCRHMHK